MLKTTILISLDYYNFTFFISWGLKMIIISGSCLLRQYDIILMISVSFSNTFHTHFLDKLPLLRLSDIKGTRRSIAGSFLWFL